MEVDTPTTKSTKQRRKPGRQKRKADESNINLKKSRATPLSEPPTSAESDPCSASGGAVPQKFDFSLTKVTTPTLERKSLSTPSVLPLIAKSKASPQAAHEIGRAHV